MWFRKAIKMAGVEKDEPEIHGGCALMLFLAPKDQQAIALDPKQLKGKEDSPELPEEIHVTLAYLGKSDSEELDGREKELVRILEVWGESESPIEGTVGGFGSFLAGDGAVMYYSFDAPELSAMRERLTQYLARHDFEIDMNHGYTPHITIAYVKNKDDVEVILPEPREITLDELTLGWANRKHKISLSKKKAR